MNWTILKTWLQEEELKAGICHRGHVPCQAGRVVNPRGHNHLSSQASTMAGRSDSFSASLGGTTSPLSSHLSALPPFLSEAKVTGFISFSFGSRGGQEVKVTWVEEALNHSLSSLPSSQWARSEGFRRYRVCPPGFIRR